MEKEKDDAIVYREDWKFNRLRLLHVPTRELSTLYAKDAHVSMFAWNQYSTEIAYVLQETPYLNSPIYRGVKFEHVVISSKSSTQICTFPGLVGSLTWTGGKDPVYDLCFRAGFTPDKVNSSGALYFLSPKDRKYKLQMYGRHDDLDEIRSSMQGKVTVKVQTGLSDILKDLDGKNLFRSLDEEISSWDIAYDKKDNLVIALTRSTTSSPTEVYSVYLDEMVGLSQHGQSIAKLAIGDSQDLHTIAEDGTKLDSVFLRPAKAPRDQPLPTALLVHGGPYYRTNVRFDIPHYRWGPLLTAAGYAVLCPNYHGGSSHGDKYASYARGQMGTVDYTDVISLLKEGISLGWIDETRVVIAGWSQGGFISYLALTRPLLFRFKGSICGAGVTEWDMMTMSSDASAFETELAGRAPWEADHDDVKARHGSAIWHMKDVPAHLRIPVLILHGEEDVRVPTTQAIAFHRDCLKYNWPCEFVRYPREGHMFQERNHLIDMLKRVRRVVDMHLQ